ncbi:MAG: aminopeptidase P family protein [Fidelibacterota bacterium]
MFTAEVYRERRRTLIQTMTGGVILFPGNPEAAVNYSHNSYPFRQDSTFLYYIGIDRPGLAAVLDADSGETTLFGTNPSLDEVVWMGFQPALNEMGTQVGVDSVQPIRQLPKILAQAYSEGRMVHYLPPYRGKVTLDLAKWLNEKPEIINGGGSIKLIKAVVAQRSVKTGAELEEIELALALTRELHLTAMRMTRPGLKEAEVAGYMEGLVRARQRLLAYPVLFSIRGEVLHNLGHGNAMVSGALVLNDTGAESKLHYASDVTRTFPVSGEFTPTQKDLYELVLAMQTKAIEQCRPGVPYRDIHLAAVRVLVEGLVSLGLMQGDPREAVAAGAHTLFFPHGLGHMLGLDVHDMENLGEEFVGYDDGIKRSTRSGLEVLRFGRELEPGFVLTVEPGLYFIPALINRWRMEDRGKEFIVFDRLDEFRSFGGIRIEDDIVITKTGCRVLGQPIPKTVAEIETLMGE